MSRRKSDSVRSRRCAEQTEYADTHGERVGRRATGNHPEGGGRRLRRRGWDLLGFSRRASWHPPLHHGELLLELGRDLRLERCCLLVLHRRAPEPRPSRKVLVSTAAPAVHVLLKLKVVVPDIRLVRSSVVGRQRAAQGVGVQGRSRTAVRRRTRLVLEPGVMLSSHGWLRCAEDMRGEGTGRLYV